jgi:hypothetical protein
MTNQTSKHDYIWDSDLETSSNDSTYVTETSSLMSTEDEDDESGYDECSCELDALLKSESESASSVSTDAMSIDYLLSDQSNQQRQQPQAEISPPFTDCLVLKSTTPIMTIYTLYDAKCNRYIIRGENTEMDTEFSFDCDSKTSLLFFMKTCFEGMDSDASMSHSLTNYTNLSANCNEIAFDDLHYTNLCGHICNIRKLNAKMLNILKHVCNKYA